MIRTWRKVAVGAIVVALLAFFMMACGTTRSYETDKANKIVTTANTLLDDYNKIQDEVNTNSDKVGALGADVPGMEQRKVLLVQIQKQIGDQTAVLDKMIAEYENGRKLYLTEDMKTYFQMLTDYIKKKKEEIALYNVIAANRIKLADDIIAGGDALALATASDAEVDALNKQAATIQAEADALKKKADKFYIDKKLGGTK
jgi:hypothetical protein